MKKIIISEKILSELNIKDKNKEKFIGYGGYQYAFQSDDKDKVIKFGRESNEDEDKGDGQGNYTITKFANREYNDDEIYEFQEMSKHPKYFPIFYKINKKFVVVEKLNSEKARQEYLTIAKFLQNNFKINRPIFKELLKEYKAVGNFFKMDEFYQKAHEFFLKNIDNQNLKSAYYKFTSLVKSIENLRLFEIDISSTNFGYDKNGNLKMLDV